MKIDGHGETDVVMYHYTGEKMGGYDMTDYFLTVEDVTGTLVLK